MTQKASVWRAARVNEVSWAKRYWYRIAVGFRKPARNGPRGKARCTKILGSPRSMQETELTASFPPPFPPSSAPAEDNWVVALEVLAVGASILCLGCALQLRSKNDGTSRVAAAHDLQRYSASRDPALLRTLECLLSGLSRHATSPEVVMQAVDALHASRHLLIPAMQLV